MNIFDVFGFLFPLTFKLVSFDDKIAFFAITNDCNSRCRMCSIWKQKNKKNVKFEDAKRVLDILHEKKFSAIQLTGGEPFLNPEIFKIIDYAKKLKLIVFIATNGSLITETVADKLASSKVEQISISFHNHNPKIFEKIERHKDILSKVSKSIDILKKKRVPVSVLCTVSKYNFKEIEKIVYFLENLGVGISFCVPVNINETSYSLGGECTKFTRSELKKVILKIIKIKKEGYNIVNSMTYLEDIISSLEGRSRYPCYGGNKLFYLDWNLNVYPCMFGGKGIKIDENSFSCEGDATCEQCLIQCFREPSVFLKSRRETVKILLKESPFFLKTIKNGIKMLR